MIGRGSHRLRLGRFSEPGRLYLLTTVTRNRTPLFKHLYYARAVIQQLRLTATHRQCQSLAWVLMPDHLHWLITLGHCSLGELMREFKSRSSCALYRQGAEHQRIWQPGFHDRALRRDEQMRSLARYIIANPIRAGLVTRVSDYPHWDCVWLNAPHSGDKATSPVPAQHTPSPLHAPGAENRPPPCATRDAAGNATTG